jgi:hypothetical protein
MDREEGETGERRVAARVGVEMRIKCSFTLSILLGVYIQIDRWCPPIWYHKLSSLGLAAAPPLFRVIGLHRPCFLYGWRQRCQRLAAAEAATALQQHVTDKLAALQAAKKKAAEVGALKRAIVLLLKKEQASVTVLDAEAAAAALHLAPTIASSSALPPPSSRATPPSSPCYTRRHAGCRTFALLSQLF